MPSGSDGQPGTTEERLGEQGQDALEARGGYSGVEAAFERLLAASRALVVVPVIVLVTAALGASVYGAYYFVRTVQQTIDHPLPAENHIAGFLIVIDLFLIGATMFIAAIGFYELFMSRVDPPGAKPLPHWLLMQDLNDLKARVIAMIVLVAAVSFIQVLVDFRSALEVTELGAGVAVVIGALTAFLRFGDQRRRED